ncbi:MAG: hypothetical protein AAF676_05125 [Pseudomonadota bacterium]
MRLIFFLFAASLGIDVAGAETPPPCGPPAEGRSLARIQGDLSAGQGFSAPLAPGFGFRLEPADAGWRLRIRDEAGLDLSAMTPPRFGPNPRDLFGWHFRDSANQGPNDGSVNAPQRLRLFEFEPALRGTAGPKPAPGAAPQPGSGRGWLYLHALGLDAFAGAAPAEQARAVWLRFEACLTWPETAEEAATEAALDGVFSDEEHEILYGCGLPVAWRPDPRLTPRWLGGDFDDDGALDHAAPVLRADGAKAIALCLAGTWLRLIGPGGLTLGDATDVASIEAWRVEDTPRGRPDELRLLRHEKSEHAVWAENRTLRARTLFRGVTE